MGAWVRLASGPYLTRLVHLVRPLTAIPEDRALGIYIYITAFAARCAEVAESQTSVS